MAHSARSPVAIRRTTQSLQPLAPISLLTYSLAGPEELTSIVTLGGWNDQARFARVLGLVFNRRTFHSVRQRHYNPVASMARIPAADGNASRSRWFRYSWSHGLGIRFRRWPEWISRLHGNRGHGGAGAGWAASFRSRRSCRLLCSKGDITIRAAVHIPTRPKAGIGISNET